MKKDKEVEASLMVKAADLKVLCRIKENLNGRIMTKTRPSGKVVVLTEEVLVLTKEELILIPKVVSIVIILDVVKKGINILNVDLSKVGRMIEML